MSKIFKFVVMNHLRHYFNRIYFLKTILSDYFNRPKFLLAQRFRGYDNHKFQNTSETIRWVNYAIFTAAIISTNVVNNEPRKYSGSDLTKEIRTRIVAAREKLSKQRKPYIQLNVTQTPNSFETIWIDLGVIGSDEMELLLSWISVLTADEKTRHVTVLKNNAASGLNFERIDRNGGVSIEYNRDKDISRVKIYMKGGFSLAEIDGIIEGYYNCFNSPAASSSSRSIVIDGFNPNIGRMFPNNFFQGFMDFPRNGMDFNDQGPVSSRAKQSPGSPLQELERLGIEIFDPSTQQLTWDHLSGYEQIKRDIEETVVNSYKYADIYDAVAKNTRVVFESNRPKAILLEGAPGTGKTLTARILASRCERPFVHLKLENIVSKWYGESENKLGKVFDLCDELGGAILFIDEVDSLATNRDTGQLHEATRRMLSVVLQRIEGFEGKGKSLLVCATNRKADLDAALLSRFDLSISYHLPDFVTRKEVYKFYAKHFAKDDKSLSSLAEATEGLSCRDLKETCEFAERRFASKKIKKDSSARGEVPALDDYLKAIEYRKRSSGHSRDEAITL